jgi:phage protein D
MMVGGTEVRVDGRPLDALLATKLVEVRVESHLLLPDLAVVRLADPGLEHVDDDPFPIGAKLEVLFSAPDSNTLKSTFLGKVAALEPEFDTGGAYLVARAYDASHALTRGRSTRTFQQMSSGDIARKLAGQAGLRVGQVDAGPAHKFVQQSDETDWALLWRLASAADCEVLVEDDQLHFRRAGGHPQDPAIDLRWGEQLLTFRPRLTGAQQVDSVTVRGWDPAGARAITATAKLSNADSEPGAGRTSVKPGGAVAVGDRPVADQDEADKLASSVAARLSNAFAEVDGTCRGDPRLRAGCRIRVDGVGQRFGGTYAPTAVTHVFRGGHGYVTRFTVSGRAARGLLGLAAQTPGRAWGSGLVIGLVTQNSDPDKLGRVRVKYPTLGDDVEGAWARIAAPGAGSSRGALMLPAVGDEVVVGFEHGDVRRPYVLGALWNGQARPEDLAQTDGTYGLRTDARLAVAAKGDITLKGGNDLTITADGKSNQKATGDLVVEGGTVTVKSNGSISVESNQQLTLKAPKVAVQASGQLQLSGSTVSIG